MNNYCKVNKSTSHEKNSRLVYSTEAEPIRPDDIDLSIQKEGDGIVRIFRESRKGSGVSIIKGLPVTTDLKLLIKTLKKKMGVGGTIKDGVLEIQSNDREKVQALLQAQGYIVKIAGG